ncbi:MAG TPA: acyl-CoA dehydrogenase family protein [Actinomycetota bacterium]|nr:acyl-CoA dehydrogenase family protein [Actinomycetota bacterium]
MGAVGTPSLAEAVERARAVADGVLFPRAQETDRAPFVPPGNLRALRDAGLLGLHGPREVTGGLGADHAAARPVLEAVAGGCGATSFVWAQHHGAVRRVRAGDGPARASWLPGLCDGSTFAGIGFAYLRRPGRPAVRAERSANGWRIEGEAPWITGWGVIDVVIVMARAADGSVVTVAVDRPGDRSELRAGPPQALAVMGATRTVTLAFDSVEVGDDDVVGVLDDREWDRRDRLGSSMPAPAPLGIADRAIRLLADLASTSAVAETAAALTARLEERRRSADLVARSVAASASADDRAFDEAIVEGARERDRGLDLARRATDALVAASGGRAMSLDHPAQRLSREATFFLIQAQTGDLRLSTLRRVAARA